MLKAVPYTPPPAAEKRRQRIKSVTPACVLECRCGSREVIDVKTGMLLKNGKPSGGTKHVLCANCYRRGYRVILA